MEFIRATKNILGFPLTAIARNRAIGYSNESKNLMAKINSHRKMNISQGFSIDVSSDLDDLVSKLEKDRIFVAVAAMLGILEFSPWIVSLVGIATGNPFLAVAPWFVKGAAEYSMGKMLETTEK